jgi:uncharacterized repeat protein (TIGR01451 family)
VRATQAGKLTSVAEATAEGSLSVKDRAVTRFVSGAGPAVDIEKPGEPLEVGKPATFRIRVFNPSTAPAAGLNLSVKLPPGLSYVSARGKTTAIPELSAVRFESLTLAPGAEAEYTVEVRAESPGPARVRADLTTGPGRAAVFWEETAEAR